MENTSVGITTWATRINIWVRMFIGIFGSSMDWHLRFYLRLVKELVYELRLLGCKINVPTLEVGQELPSLH